MANTVQTQLLRLRLAVDPRTKAGVVFTGGTVGTTDGDDFTAQRILDVYNDARRALVTALFENSDRDTLAFLLGDMCKVSSTLTMALTGDVASVAKPTDLYYFLSAWHVTDKTPVYLMPNTYMNVIRKTSQQAISGYRFIFEQGANFIGINNPVGVWPNNDTFLAAYIGMTDFTLADVTGGVVTETVPIRYYATLQEVAIAIAHEQGNAAVNALAKKLLGVE